MSVTRKIGRVAKVRALAKRAGTPGERAAAEAALERMGAPAAPAPMPASGATRLTDATVKRLASPATGNQITWDDVVPGFGVRITAAGARAYIFNYRVKGSGQQRRVTIGAVGNWSTSAARIKAKELRRIVDAGGDPRGDDEEQREAATVADLIDRFEREHLPRKRPSTRKDYKGMLNKHVRPFFGKHSKVADVDYADIDALHRKITVIGSTYVANRCVAVCSKMFSLAIKWQMRTDNPAKGIERNAESKRKRYLTADELARLVAALSEYVGKQFVDIVRVLMLTGARKGEVLAMRWTDLDLDRGVWVKPGSTTKQKTDHVVPLSVPLCQLLKAINARGEFVFPGDGKTGHVADIQKQWLKLCEAAGIKGLRIHDLRHSFASQLVSGGASLPLIGALLGHSSPTTTHRYSHLFDDPQRAAVEKIAAIVGGDRDE